MVGTATVTVAAGPQEQEFEYDQNGNMVSDGLKTFEWDAENRLVTVTITATGHRSEFQYDGMGRRICIREFDPDTSQNLQGTSDKKYLWDGMEIAQERSTDGGTVLRQYYSQGFVDTDGTVLFYTRDHMGSVRELTDGSQAVRARYDYDPYGRMTKVGGDRDSAFGFTGHLWHSATQLNLAYFRAYDPNLGRWINRDPKEEGGGLNLYQYVYGNPISWVDPEGGTPIVLAAGLAGPPGWVVVGAVAVGTIGYLVWDHFANPEVIPYSPPDDDTDSKAIPAPPPAKCNNQKCKPCKPGVGTVAYRFDGSGQHYDKFTGANIKGPHYHLYIMQQSPPPAGCKCFWKDLDKAFGGAPPPDLPLMTPAGGGGVM